MTFQDRLKKLMRRGNLTVADLARWFDRPHATLRTWVENGTEPGGGPLDREEVLKRLIKLENLVARNNLLPVPRLTPRDRVAYVNKLKEQYQ